MIDWCDKHGTFAGEQGKCPKCAQEPPPKPHPIVVGGLDLGKLHDYSALAALEVMDHKVRIPGLKVWPHIDYAVVVKETAEIFKIRCAIVKEGSNTKTDSLRTK